MLTLNQDLPQGALIGGDPAQFCKLLQQGGAAWYCALPDDLECDEDLAITGWRASTQSPLALPATGTRLAVCRVARRTLSWGEAGPVPALYVRTSWTVRTSLLAIGANTILLGFAPGYNGTDTTMSLAMASGGWLFPFFPL